MTDWGHERFRSADFFPITWQSWQLVDPEIYKQTQEQVHLRACDVRPWSIFATGGKKKKKLQIEDREAWLLRFSSFEFPRRFLEYWRCDIIWPLRCTSKILKQWRLPQCSCHMQNIHSNFHFHSNLSSKFLENRCNLISATNECNSLSFFTTVRSFTVTYMIVWWR